MKYTILINQAAVVEAGLHKITDLVDWAILEYIVAWQTNPEAERNQDDFVWINYKHFIAEMPLVGLNTKSAVSNRLKKLEELRLIEKVHDEDNRAFCKTTALFHQITQFKTKKLGRLGVHNGERGVHNGERGVHNGERGVHDREHSTNNHNKQSQQIINNNNSETIIPNNHDGSVLPSSSSLKENKHQKEKGKNVVLFPLIGLDEKQKAEASKKLAQLSQEQRDIAIEMFNNTAQQGRIKKSPMALLNQLVNMGLNNELEAPTDVFNAMPTHTPTNDIKTPVEPVMNKEEEKEKEKAQRIRIAKQFIEKNKDAMLNDFSRIGAVYIGGHGAFFEPELRAAGLFD